MIPSNLKLMQIYNADSWGTCLFLGTSPNELGINYYYFLHGLQQKRLWVGKYSETALEDSPSEIISVKEMPYNEFIQAIFEKPLAITAQYKLFWEVIGKDER
jgi:hypothetical protein